MSEQQLHTDGFDDLPPEYFEQEQVVMSAKERAGALEKLIELANELQEKDTDNEKLAFELEEKKAAADKLRRQTIPDLMSRLGIKDFTLTNGSKVDIDHKVRASVSEENRTAAHKWVKDRGDGGIIKTEVSCSFGAGEEEKAKAAAKALREAGFIPSEGERIHPSTLASYVKERLENGDDIPKKTFGVFEYDEAKIKLPKPKKKK
jgi:hypothetical protein